MLQLFALEAFLDRLSTSAAAPDYVLKGGVLLTAYALRRPTRDIDMSTRRVRNEPSVVLEQVNGILESSKDDGWRYGQPSAETIRDDDTYSGLRITIPSQLATARVNFHVDLNFGDPIWPAATTVQVPRLLGGSIRVQGYPLAMIYAEKIVTCVQRGIANTRWRDFADLYLLSRMHPIALAELSKAITVVASFRQVQMIPLRRALEGYAEIAQPRWASLGAPTTACRSLAGGLQLGSIGCGGIRRCGDIARCRISVMDTGRHGVAAAGRSGAK